MGFDISNIDAEAGSEAGMDVTIVHPVTGEQTELVITVKGLFSQAFKEALSRAIAREERRKKSKQSATEEDRNEVAHILTSVTVGWKGMQEKGEEVPFTTVNALRIYQHYPVIRSQVWEAVNETGNFIKG